MNIEDEIAKLIGAMAAIYPNTQISETTVKVYIRLLKDLPLELLSKSVEQSMVESKFFPTIAELRENVFKMLEGPRPSAIEAWGKVKEEITRVGYYHSPRFADPVIARAVECIGWQTLCLSELDNEPADRAHFAKVYDCLVLRARQEARLLPGMRQFLEERQLMLEAETVG